LQEKVVALRQELAAASPREGWALNSPAVSHRVMGWHLLGAGRAAEALLALEQAKASQQEALVIDPANVRHASNKVAAFPPR
jgi:hypothetical protein